MVNLSNIQLLRWNTSWTYKLKRYHMSPRWNVSKWLVKEEYKSQKFTKPFYLTKWGNFKTCQQVQLLPTTGGAYNKFCDMNKLHENNNRKK
ncbi:conserved Plasmodium protein, unknown function [Plasmodium reichenowi]|uniref:Uncharacterized protein n=1 Tax=Plasmodium reichenowi TaxID=5854 RepID=A0A060S623_PLARE|nr:hypothetical protein PRSY57_1464600 [Plasmodium reichenowi]KYN94304.1 hypothetical protein PRSY57_1464600 [Plasmodium reichenowi]CDO67118.1 conserved Plasmodium protein, unknown function [Plasmodium reichenowi]SOV83412.1 conserved Plasmodium protein, unknown function [Plasmodium reichenowi]